MRQDGGRDVVEACRAGVDLAALKVDLCPVGRPQCRVSVEILALEVVGVHQFRDDSKIPCDGRAERGTIAIVVLTGDIFGPAPPRHPIVRVGEVATAMNLESLELERYGKPE